MNQRNERDLNRLAGMLMLQRGLSYEEARATAASELQMPHFEATERRLRLPTRAPKVAASTPSSRAQHPLDLLRRATERASKESIRLDQALDLERRADPALALWYSEFMANRKTRELAMTGAAEAMRTGAFPDQRPMTAASPTKRDPVVIVAWRHVRVHRLNDHAEVTGDTKLKLLAPVWRGTAPEKLGIFLWGWDGREVRPQQIDWEFFAQTCVARSVLSASSI